MMILRGREPLRVSLCSCSSACACKGGRRRSSWVTAVGMADGSREPPDHKCVTVFPGMNLTRTLPTRAHTRARVRLLRPHTPAARSPTPTSVYFHAQALNPTSTHMHASEHSSCRPRSAAHASVDRTRLHSHGDAHKANKMNTDAWKCDFAGEKPRKRNAESKSFAAHRGRRGPRCGCPVAGVWVVARKYMTRDPVARVRGVTKALSRGRLPRGRAAARSPSGPAAAAHKDRGSLGGEETGSSFCDSRRAEGRSGTGAGVSPRHSMAASR